MTSPLDQSDYVLIKLATNERVPNTRPFHDHTIEEFSSYWEDSRLQTHVEKDDFVRGALAMQHKDAIEARCKDYENDMGNQREQRESGIQFQIGNFRYSVNEVRSLRASWTTSRMKTIRSLSKSHIALLVACIFAAISQGWDQSSMAGADLAWPDALGNAITISTTASDTTTIPLTRSTWRFGAVNAAPFLVGGFTGLFITDPISEEWRFGGRRGAILISGLFSFGSVIVSAACHQWWVLLVSRVCLGVGMAGKAAIVPIFLSETSPNHVRGLFVMSWQLFDAFGIAAGSTANIAVYHLNMRQSWRWMFIASCLPALLLVFLVYFSPESPRWYLKHRRVDEAFKSLKDLRGFNTPLVACGELYLLDVQLQKEKIEILEVLGRAQAVSQPSLPMPTGSHVINQGDEVEFQQQKSFGI